MSLSLTRHLAGRRPVLSRLCLLSLESRIVPSTLFVDDDRAQYPGASHTSIQAAVDDAKAGDTVQVYPGLYDEVVTVDKRLALIGSGPSSARDRTGDPTQEAVVQAVNADPLGIVNLRADGVVLRGFTVQGNTHGPGVFTDPKYSGYLIESNLIWRNNPGPGQDPNGPSGGLHLNSSGGHLTVVRANAFEEHTAESFGDGVYTELTLRKALIEGNYFKGNVHYSVDFAGAPGDPGFPGFKKFYPRSADVVITDNVIEESGGILVQYADRIVVANNSITHATRTGVYVGGDVHGVTVTNNTLTDAVDVPGFGKHTGIFVGTLDIPGTIQGVVISGNTIHGHLNGIWLGGDAATGPVSGVAVIGNTVAGNDQYGILLTDADRNLILGNDVSDNAWDGIHVDAASTGNTFARNSATGNGGFDLYDGSTGRGTAGTANDWFANEFGTAYPPGLS